MKDRPVIALTPDVQEKTGGRLAASINKEYTDAVIAAGGLPFVLPLTDDEVVLDALLARVDGLLLTGGGDVDPALYGASVTAEVKPTLKTISPVRDRMELFLTRRVLRDARQPLLGICRGCQVLNVAGGGTLILDIPSTFGNKVDHHDKRIAEPVHEILVQPKSRLAALVGGSKLTVNSSHHQAVRDVAPKFHLVAHSTGDGVVEGIELDGRQFAIGVQWHPERLYTRHEHAAALFRALVEAAAAAKATGTR
ncbi:MAG: gamma-glutamyl-gamma-aminobutyrate hydrolase family protein [Verrucomicrobia bacterium]|nr:gamma-glutamyl-gamma-aminobutyrate hydrolase family protein [Verrucomicrobiota bacterium]